jgi:hypothetical protein
MAGSDFRVDRCPRLEAGAPSLVGRNEHGKTVAHSANDPGESHGLHVLRYRITSILLRACP